MHAASGDGAGAGVDQICFCFCYSRRKHHLVQTITMFLRPPKARKRENKPGFK